jgi:hypothetical protein
MDQSTPVQDLVWGSLKSAMSSANALLTADPFGTGTGQIIQALATWDDCDPSIPSWPSCLLHANSCATYITTELMAAIPAVWPAVAMCPVVQKEIAKISAVPISRHVTAFAIGLANRDALLALPTGASPVHPCEPCAARFSGVRWSWAEFRRGPWSYAKSC